MPDTLTDVTIRELLDTLEFSSGDMTQDISDALWALASFRLGQLQHGHPQSKAIVKLFNRAQSPSMPTPTSRPTPHGITVIPNPNVGGHRTGTLTNITKKDIDRVLGFTPNVEDDPDKVKYSWGFTVDGQEYGIWDYKGSWRDKEFSTYGPNNVFALLFGERYKPYP